MSRLLRYLLNTLAGIFTTSPHLQSSRSAGLAAGDPGGGSLACATLEVRLDQLSGPPWPANLGTGATFAKELSPRICPKGSGQIFRRHVGCLLDAERFG